MQPGCGQLLARRNLVAGSRCWAKRRISKRQNRGVAHHLRFLSTGAIPTVVASSSGPSGDEKIWWLGLPAQPAAVPPRL